MKIISKIIKSLSGFRLRRENSLSPMPCTLCAMAFVLLSTSAFAQVTLSNEVQTRNGREYYVHIAQQGQTVFSIARAYGLHYSVAVLKTDVQSMSVGDTVWLPVNEQSRAKVREACGSDRAATPARPQEPTKEITVEPKQTLFSLAKAYGTTVEHLEELNPGLKANGLKAGQTLRVPATKPTAPAGAAPKPQPKPAPAAKPAKTEQPPVALQPRERIHPDKVYVSVMMPLYLNKMDEISTTKFDVDQRGKKSYPSFEYIQFYEGILLALEQLESQGIHVVLNVVDVVSDADTAVAGAFRRHNVRQSDFVIALLTRKPFGKLCELAREERLFVISPLSTRDEIVDNNPYVVKYQPSNAAIAQAMLRAAQARYPQSHLYLVHSKGKEEAPLYNAFLTELQASNTPHTIVDWAQAAKLPAALKQTKENVVISIYEQGKDKNRIHISTLMNRISGSGQNVLMTRQNLVRDMADVDYQQLQKLSYHLLYTAYLDYDDPAHKAFIDRYKQRFKTEPMDSYAALGNDIMLYFTTAIAKKGSQFWASPSIPRPHGMLFPLRIARKDAHSGFENQTAVILRMDNYRLVKTQ